MGIKNNSHVTSLPDWVAERLEQYEPKTSKEKTEIAAHLLHQWHKRRECFDSLYESAVKFENNGFLTFYLKTRELLKEFDYRV